MPGLTASFQMVDRRPPPPPPAWGCIKNRSQSTANRGGGFDRRKLELWSFGLSCFFDCELCQRRHFAATAQDCFGINSFSDQSPGAAMVTAGDYYLDYCDCVPE